MTNPTLRAQIANHLRRDILRGKLAPGAPIKERDNAAELGVSRTPMREAIRILAKEGLVILRPARSPIVANPTLKEVSDQIEVLIALEILSGRLAVENATDDEIAAIRERNERFIREFDTADVLDRFEMDMDFHFAIAQASHNAALAETHRAYLERLWRARFLSARNRHTKERVIQQHCEIVRGLEGRDVTGEIHAHLKNLLDAIRDKFSDTADTARPAEDRDAGPGVGAGGT